MGKALFTPLARDDLKKIRDFIARDKPKTASRYMEILKQKCDLLARYPALGVTRKEYCGLYKFSVDEYLIFYRPSETGIHVMRILHSKRDIEAIFS